MDVTVVVATYGDPSWINLATNRAIPSAERLKVPVFHAHGESLDDARNIGLQEVKTEWVCHLDADDELEPGYFAAMETGSKEMRAPSVRYVRHGATRTQTVLPRVSGHTHVCQSECLKDGNFMVIGTVVKTELAIRAGGWRDYPWSEDWDLWQRCWLAGGQTEWIPAAVYKAYIRNGSRNRSGTHQFKLDVHHKIRQANMPHLYE